MKIGRIFVVVFSVFLTVVTISSCDTKEPEQNIGLQQSVQETVKPQENVGDSATVPPHMAVEKDDEEQVESDDENAPTDEEDVDTADEGEDMDDEDMGSEDMDDEDMDDEDMDDEDMQDVTHDVEQQKKMN